CFEVERRLRASLDIPVFHDDQHGTAIVVMAALMNALRLVGKDLPELRVVVSGVGAAGVACSRMLLAAGVRDLVGVDTAGAIYRGRRERMNPAKEQFARDTNPAGRRGALSDV